MEGLTREDMDFLVANTPKYGLGEDKAIMGIIRELHGDDEADMWTRTLYAIVTAAAECDVSFHGLKDRHFGKFDKTTEVNHIQLVRILTCSHSVAKRIIMATGFVIAICKYRRINLREILKINRQKLA